MDLVDALSSNNTAKSGVDLTLNPKFQRTYTALNKVVAVECLSGKQIARLAAKGSASQLPRPWERYLPSVLNKSIIPAAVQRDMVRIIR